MERKGEVKKEKEIVNVEHEELMNKILEKQNLYEY